MSTLHRNGAGLRVAGWAYVHRQLAVWLIAAIVLLPMATAAFAAGSMAGTPPGPLDMPTPQPAPVGP